MVSFRLVSLSPLGDTGLRKFRKKDKKMLVTVLSESPLTISFVPKTRLLNKFITEDVIRMVTIKALKSKGCVEDRDYEIRVK